MSVRKHRGCQALLLALCFLLLLAPAFAQSPDEARIHEIMRKVTTEDATSRGVKTVIFWSQERGSDAVIVKTYRSGDKSRFDYLPSPHRPASIVIENAQQVMYYQPGAKLLVTEDHTSSSAEDLQMLDLAFANYDWDIEGDAMVAGHKTIIFKTTRKDSGTIVQRLWIEPKHHLVLRKEAYNIRGELAFASYYTEVDFPDEISPELFKLTTPQGTRMVERAIPMKLSTANLKPQLGFDPVIPTLNGQPVDLANGFHLIGMQRETLNGYRALRLSYSDGLEVISLVEMPNTVHSKSTSNTKHLAALGQKLQFQALLEGNLLQWRDDRLFYTLVGNLPEDEMTAFYHSLYAALDSPPPSPPAAQPPTLMDYFWRGVKTISRVFTP